MTLLYILLAVYIAAVNFYSFFLVRIQRENSETGEEQVGKGDPKLLLAALLGGATAIYCAMFVFRFRLSNLLLMVAMPVLACLNLYSFFLGFRGIGLIL